jgi:hypothetical protein
VVLDASKGHRSFIIMGLKGRREDFLGLYTVEDEGAAVLRNISNHPFSDAASFLRRTDNRLLNHSTVKIS